jgi:hypothetical protein
VNGDEILNPFEIGQQVTARFDFAEVQITEMNISVSYSEGKKEKKMDLFVMATTTNPPFAAVVGNALAVCLDDEFACSKSSQRSSELGRVPKWRHGKAYSQNV